MSDSADGDVFGTGLPIDTVVSRPQPGTVVLEVDGEIDTLTAPRLEADLVSALAAGNSEGTSVIVDLTNVTFLASSGLAVLIYGARRATAAGRRLHVVAATRSVTRPMTVTGADTLFDTHADLDSALAAVTARGVAPPPAGGGR